MKKCLLITLIVILLADLCSCSNQKNLYPTFNGHSDNWNIQIIQSKVTEEDKQQYKLQNQNNLKKEELTLTYKGKDLNKVSEVYFVLTKSSGTSKVEDKLFNGRYHYVTFYDGSLNNVYKTLDITWNDLNENINLSADYKAK